MIFTTANHRPGAYLAIQNLIPKATVLVKPPREAGTSKLSINGSL